MRLKSKDRKAVKLSIHPCPPEQIYFNTCVCGGAGMGKTSVTGRGKSGWKKQKWLSVWKASHNTTHTKHNTNGWL